MVSLPLGPGVHDLPPDAYHADPCERPSLSASLATLLVQATPLHAWAASPRLNPDFEPTEKPAFDLGAACHELLTGKGRGIHVVEADDYRTKAAQAERDDARARGFVPLTRPQHAQVERMLRAARAQMAAHGIGNPFERGRNEVTLLWERDGVLCRAMVDCLIEEERVVYDLKTTAGLADPERWVETAMGHGIDVRAAHYLDGLVALFGGDWTYRYIPLEKEQPHCLSVVQLSESALFMGRKKIARAREVWRACLEEGVWPGWSAEIAEVTPRAYHEARWIERESVEADHRRRTGADILAAALRWQAPEGASP